MTNNEKAIFKIIVSDGVEGTGQPGTPPMLIGPTLTLNMPVVPTALSFNVAVLAYKMDFSEPQKLQLSIISHDKPTESIQTIAGNLPAMTGPVGTMVFNFGVHNTVFHKVGAYDVLVSLNDKEVARDTFWTTNTGSTNGTNKDISRD